MKWPHEFAPLPTLQWSSDFLFFIVSGFVNVLLVGLNMRVFTLLDSCFVEGLVIASINGTVYLKVF